MKNVRPQEPASHPDELTSKPNIRVVLAPDKLEQVVEEGLEDGNDNKGIEDTFRSCPVLVCSC